jgi:hypothetical protein
MPESKLPDELVRRILVPAGSERPPRPANAETRDCYCWRQLVAPLRDDPALPDHICTLTMKETVARWWTEQWGVHGRLLLTSLQPPLPPQTQVALRLVGREHRVVWPPDDAGRRLLYVITEWVEGASNKGLTRRLRALPGWLEEVAFLKALAEPGAPEAVRLVRDQLAVDEWIGLESSDEAMAFRLRRRGLPPTPSVIAAIRADALEQKIPLCADAVRVRTFAYALRARDGRMWEHDANPEVETRSFLYHTSLDLTRKTYSVEHKHRAFCKRVCDSPATTEHAVHQAAALEAREDWPAPSTDWWEEVYAASTNDPNRGLLHAYRLQAEDQGRAPSIPVFVQGYVDRLYDRMRHRMRAAGLPTRPPRGFKQNARDYLVTWLRDRLEEQKTERPTSP